MKPKSILAAMVALSVTSAALGTGVLTTHAATPMQTLRQALHDTDTVHTLVYTSVSEEQQGTTRVVTVIRGQEDEAANRESDQEVISFTTPSTSKTGKSRVYALQVMFVDGKTYYRYPLKNKNWSVRSGMKFKDPATGALWKRGRTDVPVKGMKFTYAGATSTALKFTAPVTAKGATGTLTLYVGRGATPYVSLLTSTGKDTVQGHTTTFTDRWMFGPFNTQLNITAPLQST